MKFKNKKGVFGLTAVQGFFALILGIGLLAYIIVVIMGVLSNTSILPAQGYAVVNETGHINQSNYTLAQSTIAGFASPSIVAIYNNTAGSGDIITAGNYSLIGNVLTNTTTTAGAAGYNFVLISYTYTGTSVDQNRVNTILSNTSAGVSGFFQSINPVYAILAVLVIILVLVVLVRVVQTPGGRENTPQL